MAHSEYLDARDKCDLVHDYSELGKLLTELKMIGGCCDTDHTHLNEISRNWMENDDNGKL